MICLYLKWQEKVNKKKEGKEKLPSTTTIGVNT